MLPEKTFLVALLFGEENKDAEWDDLSTQCPRWGAVVCALGPYSAMWVSKFRGHLCPFYGPLEMQEEGATWELGDLRLVPGPSDRYIPEEVQHSIGGLPTAPYHMPMMHDRVMVNVTCLSLQRIVWSYATVRLQSFLESNLDFFISLGI
jgi:hypothetical protein